ncbi:MAG: FAD-dependent oxidoreductase [Kineosporiaceae bacterium]|jgi:D-amino-acid oxidase
MWPRVTVVGAGIVGLSCAVRLAESGREVAVLARDLPEETTSAQAAGLWLPDPTMTDPRVAAWASATREELTALAAHPDTGVRLADGQLVYRTPAAPPAWTRTVAGPLPLDPVDTPVPGFAFGLSTRLPLVDLRRYLPYLRERLAAAGGTLTRMALTALPARGLVINCTGLAARALVPDPEVRPLRGQVALVRAPDVDRWRVYRGGPGDLRYVLPLGDRVLVGGTVEDGVWDLDPDPDTARDLLARAVELDPGLRGAEVLGHRVGLRPHRPRIRVAVGPAPTEDDPGRILGHCYGHGSSGVTLSWGCADEVAARVAALGSTGD